MEITSGRQSAVASLVCLGLLSTTGWSAIGTRALAPDRPAAPGRAVQAPPSRHAAPGTALRLVQAVGGLKAGGVVRKSEVTPPPTTAAAPATVLVDEEAGPRATGVVDAPPVQDLLPYGKGMWIYQPDKTEGANAAAIVAKAKAAGLSHLYVRMGSAWDGFNVAPFVDRLLPAAHAAGIQVFGWDFPKLEVWQDDIKRARTMIAHTAPGGHRIDGFSADIETRAEGTRISAQAAADYGKALREAVGPGYPLIATVPRPSPGRASFPYAEVVASYDAIAPMVYWLNRQPDSDVAGALAFLARFNKPVFPVGQAYDGGAEGGRKGVPSRDELLRFTRAAAADGAAGVSFWSWQAADRQAWDAVRDAAEFHVAPLAAALVRARATT